MKHFAPRWGCPVPSARSLQKAAPAARHWQQNCCGFSTQSCPPELQFTYSDALPLREKIEAVCKKIYRASAVTFSAEATRSLAEFEKMGCGSFPVCIAKTQYSFSDNAKLLAAPEGFTVNVRQLRLSAGAGFVVAICGNIMTMPGLPKRPAAEQIDLDEDGRITGLF